LDHLAHCCFLFGILVSRVSRSSAASGSVAILDHGVCVCVCNAGNVRSQRLARLWCSPLVSRQSKPKSLKQASPLPDSAHTQHRMFAFWRVLEPPLHVYAGIHHSSRRPPCDKMTNSTVTRQNTKIPVCKETCRTMPTRP